MTQGRDHLPQRDLATALAEDPPSRAAPVLIDFDHTLLAANSTELFILSCRPHWMAAAIDFVVRDCIPWRMTGLPHWFRLRDYMCCLMLALLMPWTILAWRRRAPALFAAQASDSVAEALAPIEAARCVIVSFGMAWLIRPMLRGSRWEAAELMATPLKPARRNFSRGKLALLDARFGRRAVAEATAISDSLDDRDLLLAARQGILIPPQGEAVAAAERRYFPLRYSIRAKYGLLHMLDKVLLVDFAILLLGTSRDLDDLLRHAISIPFLLLSLHCVYEMGYFENDMVAAKREAKPTLSKEAARFRDYPIQPAGWVWAIGLGLLGCLAAAYTRSTSSLALLPAITAWAILLVLLRLAFHAYNQQPVQGRLPLYAVLQMMKYLPVFFLIHPTMMGVLLSLSQVAMMWIVYIVYRSGGDHRGLNKEMIRGLFWVVGAGLLATTGRYSLWGSLLPVGLMLAWCLLRLAKPRLMELAKRRPAPALTRAK
ncbi:hypothetical protein [Roseomonas sp. 18066]|uniref:hypothetical protein n=1 Tax=Roseomonas sp. 18066 TaxID=2681412 RepID=UPI00135B1803|nr:hypothetical protein [Roseomonas sp. 18066]